MQSKTSDRAAFKPGIDTLLSRHKSWLKGKRVGLVSHLAAVDSKGCSTAQRLWEHKDSTVVCLMGPEHGYFGSVAAGKSCKAGRHPDWKIPIHSLYGTQRRPSKRVLKGLDVIVVDLQDMGMRPYTYVSTLRLVLEAAAECGTPVIVADRPIPLPVTVDGPCVDAGFESFVSAIPAPMVYGMTPGETALWLQATAVPTVTLHVANMQGYSREAFRGPDWPPWLCPSPSIVSWETAICYPATVGLEGISSLDHGRATDMPFQLVGAPWINGEELAAALAEQKLQGVLFYAHHHQSNRPDYAPGKTLSGIRMVVTNPKRYRPILTSITLLYCLQSLYGPRRLWAPKQCRTDFFDKLFGTDQVRLQLKAGSTPSQIAQSWKAPLRQFSKARRTHLLYESAAS
jgi:uncharacterized protein YbbC (DUF1343 family)